MSLAEIGHCMKCSRRTYLPSSSIHAFEEFVWQNTLDIGNESRPIAACRQFRAESKGSRNDSLMTMTEGHISSYMYSHQSRCDHAYSSAFSFPRGAHPIYTSSFSVRLVPSFHNNHRNSIAAKHPRSSTCFNSSC